MFIDWSSESERLVEMHHVRSLSEATMNYEIQVADLEIRKLKKLLLQLKIKDRETDAEDSADWRRPHRKYHTKVFRTTGGWVCVMYDVDKGDMWSNEPHGVGPSPAAACDDFDFNWHYEEEPGDDDGEVHFA